MPREKEKKNGKIEGKIEGKKEKNRKIEKPPIDIQIKQQKKKN